MIHIIVKLFDAIGSSSCFQIRSILRSSSSLLKIDGFDIKIWNIKIKPNEFCLIKRQGNCPQKKKGNFIIYCSGKKRNMWTCLWNIPMKFYGDPIFFFESRKNYIILSQKFLKIYKTKNFQELIFSSETVVCLFWKYPQFI